MKLQVAGTHEVSCVWLKAMAQAQAVLGSFSHSPWATLHIFSRTPQFHATAAAEAELEGTV